MGNAKGHKLSEYIKLNEKKDKRLKKYKRKRKGLFSLHSEKLKVAAPWT